MGQPLKLDRPRTLQQSVLPWRSPDNPNALYEVSMVVNFTPDIVSPGDGDLE